MDLQGSGKSRCADDGLCIVTAYYTEFISAYSLLRDARDLAHLVDVFKELELGIVVHMAVRSMVREAYRNSVYTYETNVMGTVNVMKCVRLNPCVKSFINVTSDKECLSKERE